jgi:DNA-binding CsgD family transcriptional regulator
MDPLDMSTPVGQAYLAMVTNPRLTEDELGSATQLAAEDLRAVLAYLVRAGLARPQTESDRTRWEPEAPDQGVERLLEAEEQQLAQARRTSRHLSRLYWIARREDARYAGVEVVRGEGQFVERFTELVATATREVRSCNRPPWLRTKWSAIDQEADVQAEQIRKGVVFRSIWWEGLFEDPSVSRGVSRMAHDGEQSRLLVGDLPLKMVIADDERAIVYLDMDDHDRSTHLLVYSSGLLQLLIRIFDALWSMSTPIMRPAKSGPGPFDVTERDREILTMLASGASDAAIARYLGVSPRTVLRQTALLSHRLGAKTRFQTGVQAVRHGLIS